MAMLGAPPPLETPIEFPTPRDALDTGSLAELADDCREMRLPLVSPTALTHPHSDLTALTVPDDARALVAGLSDYGS